MIARSLLLASLFVLGCSPRTRPADIVPCTAGQMVQIGCAMATGRLCRGDPALRICDGATVPASCVEGAPGQLAFDDDAGGSNCPLAQVVCPSTGAITVVPEGRGEWVCPWETAVVPIADRGPETLSCTPGAMLAAGCDGVVGDVCRGDPTLRVCEGNLDPGACATSSLYLVEDDDGGDVGQCPRGSFTCPASGRITVVPAGYGGRPGTEWDCIWDIGVPAI